MKHIVFSICSNNYFAQAVVLNNSLQSTNPNSIFYLCVTDNKSISIDYSAISNVLFVEDLKIPSFEKMVQRYSIIELNTAIKPYVFSYLLSAENDCDMVTYLDPDICVYHLFDVIESLIKDYNFILTPHITSPYPLDDNIPTEEDILNTGMYNLGYISIKNNLEGRNMLEWWKERLKDKADIDFYAGHFTDQIWMNFIPLYFRKVYVLCNLGYNVAYWNLHERKLVEKENSIHVINSMSSNPLVFFHFSGYNPLKPMVYSRYQTRFNLNDNQILKKLCDEYREQLLVGNYTRYSTIECSYQIQHQKYILDIRINQLNKLSKFQRKYRVLLLKLQNYISEKIISIEKKMSN